MGKKLGGGKGSISHYVTPIKAGRVIMEVGGNLYWEEVRPWLSNVCTMFNFEVCIFHRSTKVLLRNQNRCFESYTPNFESLFIGTSAM